MKIKILSQPHGNHKIGDIVEAIKNPTQDVYAAYDSYGLFYHYNGNQIEVIEETKQNSGTSLSLKELFGQDVKIIEFK